MGAEKGGRASGGEEVCLVIVSGECCRGGVGVGVGEALKGVTVTDCSRSDGEESQEPDRNPGASL